MSSYTFSYPCTLHPIYSCYFGAHIPSQNEVILLSFEFTQFCEPPPCKGISCHSRKYAKTFTNKFCNKIIRIDIFFSQKWKGVLSDHCPNGYLLTPNHRPKSNSGTIVLNPRWDIWSTQSTVLAHKRIFYNICEDLNFVSQASNHIIWYLSVQVGNLGKDCHQPILFNELHKSVHEKKLGLRSHSR